MSASSVGFESELRIPTKSVITVLAAFGLVFQVMGSILYDPLKVLDFALLIQVLSAATWVLDNWKPWVGRWITIIALIIVIQLIDSGLDVPGTQALMAIPTALAAALISLPAATATAVGETVLLLLLSRYAVVGTSPASIGLALIAIWTMLGVMYAVYHPVHQLAQWSWEHFQQAQTSLEAARNRQVELKQALEDLAHANRQLTLLNEKLATLRLMAEEAQKTKAAFVAKVSHEFRTPLNMIIGLIDLLVETPEVYGDELPPALLEDLKIVHRNCEHLSSMINDVLDLSQVEAGRLALHRERVNLAEVIDKALVVVRPLLDKKNLDLRVIIPDDLPETYCDRTRIRQVILNLMSNAARFTEEGGITVRAIRKNQDIVISVSDTGPGIPPEEAERIFEPFHQSSGALWRSKGGSGLGLSISKQFVELHGGRMWLESKLGVGSTFYFKLPITPPMEPISKPGRWIARGWVERTSRTDRPVARLEQRIIICDETGELYPLFTRYSDDVEYVDTRNLAQAVQESRRCPAHAVVLNAISPGDLLSMAAEAKRIIPDIPIIGYCCPPEIGRGVMTGVVDYLIKPIKRATLDRAIQAIGKPVRRVLAVDDDHDALDLLTRMLYACDNELKVTGASNGEQALNELRRESFDLVLLDILMPDMDGWQVLAAKNQNEVTRDIPVIVISGQDPRTQPLASEVLLVAMGDRLPVSKILRCSREIPALLLQPD